MQTLADLLFPVTVEAFLADHEGRKPLHIPSDTGATKSALLSWDAFNGLLNQSHVWTETSLLLMLNAQAVQPDQYCRTVQTTKGPVLRPCPSKIEVFLSGGASLVANDVLFAHPPLTRLGQALGEAFAARVGANIYCSFQGVRAFGSHYDNHDVFVVQTEGEKVWNLYENRADNPLDLLPGTDETRHFFERARGPVMAEVHMKAGDVLYLPRGWYHDALAMDGASLHVTYAVTPLTGQSIVGLLDTLASKQSAYRAFLAPADRQGGELLRGQISDLKDLLDDILSAPDFLEAVAAAQRRTVPATADFSLPQRKPVTLYRTTGHAFPPTTPGLRLLYDWAIAERQFALEDMVASFEGLSLAQVRAAVDAAEGAKALKRA